MDLAKPTMWEIVKAICAVAGTLVLSVKIYETPIVVTVDFPTLLSLLLALFSVALAALFYFKATDTSNTFYNNTYQFTRDIATLLTKMESGFGERLKHLDEGYSSMRTSLEGQPSGKSDEAVVVAKQKLEEEKEEFKKVLEQRNRIVKDLIERSQLHSNEKEDISSQLKKKEEELTELQQTTTRLNRQLVVERMRRHRLSAERGGVSEGMDQYTKSRVIENIGVEQVIESSASALRVAFNEMSSKLPRGYVQDLERQGFVDDGLTLLGVKYLKRLAREDAA